MERRRRIRRLWRIRWFLVGQLSSSLPWQEANPKWASALNPILANLLMQGSQFGPIVFVANTPQTLNHYLGKMQNGFFVTDQNAAASIYRTQPFNSKTITLESSANVTIQLWCY